MKTSEVLEHFEKLTQEMNIDLRYEKGDFKGGLCRVDEQQILIINSKLLEEEKIKIFANEFGHLDLNNVYVIPAIRELIDEQNKK